MITGIYIHLAGTRRILKKRRVTGCVETCFINFELGHEDIQFSARMGPRAPSRRTLVNYAFYLR